MKSLFFIFILLTIFSGSPVLVSAQGKRHSTNSKTSVSRAGTLKFIEGIEIKRELMPVAESVSSDIPVKQEVVPGIRIDVEKCLLVQFKYAQLLNREVESVTNIPLFTFIESWWETPYRYGGTTKAGIDCSAFAGLLFSKVYAADIPRTAKEQYTACEKMERGNLSEGDLVFFNTRGGVSHVGIYLGGGYFVHASTVNGVTINNLDDDYYSARFLGGGKVLHSPIDGVAKAVISH